MGRINNWDSVPIILDLAFAANILGISEEQTRRLCVSGELPARKIGGMWRLTKEDLRGLFEKRGEEN